MGAGQEDRRKFVKKLLGEVRLENDTLHILLILQIICNIHFFLDKGIIGCPATRGQLSPSGRPLRSCTVRFMLRPAVLVSTPGWVRPAISASRLGTVSGQVQPARYRTNPPSAYISKRATDMITSFQVTR